MNIFIDTNCPNTCIHFLKTFGIFKEELSEFYQHIAALFITSFHCNAFP